MRSDFENFGPFIDTDLAPPKNSSGAKLFRENDVISSAISLRSWRDFVRECFCFGSEAVNASGEAVKGLVKSRVEFPPAQISGVF